MSYNLLMPEEEQRSLRTWLWQRRWWIALATLFILVWWLVPLLLYRYTGTTKDAKLKAITDTRTALLAGLIGVGALLTFWLNSRVYRITARTLQITEQGHITERYTKAIEQLGSAKLDVRLGGIYALERIAVDSKRDHPTVVEVLSAFIREHSNPAHTDAEPTIAEVLRNFLQGDAEPAAEPQPSSGTEKGLKPATDVQAALTVLGRLPKRAGVSRGDLAHARLRGAQLRRADLSGAWLGEADLTNAELPLANLSRARLPGTNLSGARLVGTNLSGAWLRGADLSGADLDQANLTDAKLIEANLTGAKLLGANLIGTSLIRADLTGARLGGADLSDAGLGGADLTETLGIEQPPARRRPWRSDDSASGRATAAGRLGGRRGMGGNVPPTT